MIRMVSTSCRRRSTNLRKPEGHFRRLYLNNQRRTSWVREFCFGSSACRFRSSSFWHCSSITNLRPHSAPHSTVRTAGGLGCIRGLFASRAGRTPRAASLAYAVRRSSVGAGAAHCLTRRVLVNAARLPNVRSEEDSGAVGRRRSSLIPAHFMTRRYWLTVPDPERHQMFFNGKPTRRVCAGGSSGWRNARCCIRVGQRWVRQKAAVGQNRLGSQDCRTPRDENRGGARCHVKTAPVSEHVCARRGCGH